MWEYRQERWTALLTAVLATQLKSVALLLYKSSTDCTLITVYYVLMSFVIHLVLKMHLRLYSTYANAVLGSKYCKSALVLGSAVFISHLSFFVS